MDSKKNCVLEINKKKNDKPYIIIGAGGHAKVVVDILYSQEKEIYGFVDDNRATLRNLKYLGNLGFLNTLSLEIKKNYYFIIAIGQCSIRRAIYEKLKIPNEFYGSAIHSTACISDYSFVSNGTVIMPNVVVNADALIGNHVILNTGCIIDHDGEVDDFAHIAPGTCLTGGVSVGEGTLVGVGSRCVPLKKIGSWSIIGAGSTVVSNIPDNVLAYGTPAKIMKEGINDEF
ncbi:acetyltransferase [Enterococcus faecium]|nr:acetyltransferase [Enterococcus faecium]